MTRVFRKCWSHGGRCALLTLLTLLALPAAAVEVAAVGEDGDRETLSGNYLSAHHAEYLGDSVTAAEYLSRVLGSDSDNPSVQRRAFVHLVASGRVEEAVALAEKVSGRGQTEALATVTRAVVTARDGDYEAAGALVEEPLPGSFGQFMAPLLRGWILAGTDDTVGAVKALEPLAENDGFGLFRDFHTALIYDIAGDTAKADEFYALALGADDTPSSRLLEARISFLMRNGRTDEARDLFEGTTSEERNSMPLTVAASNLEAGTDVYPFVSSPSDGLSEALFEVAAELKREGAANVALFLAQLAVYLRPGFDIAQVLIAEILDDQNQLDEALRAYDRIGPDSPLAWQVRVRRAELLSETGKVDEAIALLEDMAKERSERPEPLIRIGHILRSERRFDDAVVAYDRAIERIPDFEPHHWPLLYARGIALERSKDWSRAEKDFLQALEFNPDQPYVLNYLGYSWVDQGINLDRAREMIERAVELRPRDGYIVDSLGWALYRMGDFGSAVGHLEEAVELRPEDLPLAARIADQIASTLVENTRLDRSSAEFVAFSGPKPRIEVAAYTKSIDSQEFRDLRQEVLSSAGQVVYQLGAAIN